MVDTHQPATARLATATRAELEAARDRIQARIDAIRAGGTATPDSLRVNEGALRRVVAEMRARR